MHSPDWLPVPLALTILVARYSWRLFRGQDSRAAFDLRRAWVKRVLAAPGLEIMAVQTVRNSIMAASLMATTSAFGLMGVLSIGHTQVGRLNAQNAGHWLDVGTELKLFLPLALLAACVVLFSKSVRLYHRAGYSLGLAANGTPREGPSHTEVEQIAISELTRAAQMYRNGWRAIYAAIATGAWLVSGWIMLATTIIIVAIDIFARVE